MKANRRDDVMEQVEADQHTGRRNALVLIAVPPEGFAQVVFVGQTKTAAIGGPKAKTFPAPDFEILVKCGNGNLKKIAKKPW